MNNIDRRSLLKFFGVGTTITPLLGGAPLMQAAARLVELPTVELIQTSEEDMPRLWSSRLDFNPFERLWLARWRHEQSHYLGELYT